MIIIVILISYLKNIVFPHRYINFLPPNTYESNKDNNYLWVITIVINCGPSDVFLDFFYLFYVLSVQVGIFKEYYISNLSYMIELKIQKFETFNDGWKQHIFPMI